MPQHSTQRRDPIFAKEAGTLYAELHRDLTSLHRNFQEREEIHSVAAMPLLVEKELVGILFVNYRQPQRFDATQRLFIEGLAHYAAIAIKNSQEFKKLSQRRLRELEILQWIDRALSRNLDLDAVLHTLLEMAREQVPADEVSILLYHADAQVLATAAAIGRHVETSLQQTISLQDERGIPLWVLEHRRPVRIANIHQELPWRD